MPLVLLLACAAPAAHVWIGGDVHRADGTGPLLAFAPGGVGIVNLEGPVGAALPTGASAGAPLPTGASVEAALPTGADLGAPPFAHPRLFNTPASLAALADAGVRVAGIVNNHATDTGSLDATTRALADHGIAAAGPTLVSFAEGGVLLHVSAVDLSSGNPPDLAARFAEWGALDGTWIATFHTDGDTYLPGPAVHAAVEAAVAAGADIVAVHGSHKLGPVERRPALTGTSATGGGAIIAWGLGNLVFSCPCTRDTEALLLEVDLPSGEVTLRPIAAGLDGAPATPSPDPDGIFDLLAAIGSTPLERHGATAALR